MALNNTQVKNAKPLARPYKLADGEGMYLHVQPNGGKYWRLKYRHGGKEKVLAIGTYPALSIVDARKRREKARDLLREGVCSGSGNWR